MIETIQSQLTAIYDLQPIEDVRGYLIDEKSYLALKREPFPLVAEELLVIESTDSPDEGHLAIGLFLRRDVLETLSHHRPERGLHPGNWSDFCAAVEGVSHFLFLGHRAQHDLSLSALEMEVQAEVDKFVTSFMYRYQETSSCKCAEEVFETLFTRVRFRENLADHEAERYRIASDVAGRFCQHLCERYLVKPNWHGLFQDLRHFYRRGWTSKYTASIAHAY